MSKIPRFLLIVFCAAVLVRLTLLYVDTQFSHRFTIQQDNYANYAHALRLNLLHTGYLSPFDTRLFPGYPILIAGFASFLPFSEIAIGVTISIVTSIFAIILFWKWTQHSLATTLFAFIPPMWLQSNVKVSTEPLSVFLMLGSILLYKRQKFFFTGVLLGYTCTVRNIAFFLFLSLLSMTLKNKEPKNVFKLLLGFSFPVLALLIFNQIFWNQPLYQFMTYGTYSKMMFGVTALFTSLIKNIQHKEFRILISSGFYLLFTFWGTAGLVWAAFKKKGIYSLACVWGVLSLAFLFTVSFSSFLEDFGRYTVPFLPATILGITAFDYSRLFKKHKSSSS
jgi:hypothetical protein